MKMHLGIWPVRPLRSIGSNNASVFLETALIAALGDCDLHRRKYVSGQASHGASQRNEVSQELDDSWTRDVSSLSLSDQS